jgi:hypothetical protein
MAAKAELTTDVLSVLLSVLVTPFTFTVTEQEIIAPLCDTGRDHKALVVANVTDSEVCIMSLINKL